MPAFSAGDRVRVTQRATFNNEAPGREGVIEQVQEDLFQQPFYTVRLDEPLPSLQDQAEQFPEPDVIYCEGVELEAVS